MRVGVVCEGVTDFIAIREYIGARLERAKIDCVFVQLQPTPDNTDDGGWTRVFFWLQQNGPDQRRARHLGGGLFANQMDEQVCDALVIQIDTDILSDAHFINHMRNLGIAHATPTGAPARVREVKRLLAEFARFEDLTNEELVRHIFIPAAESTEAWCVAAFERHSLDPEELQGRDLWGAFGACLLRSEGRQTMPPDPPGFGPPDKTPGRRERFCKTHRGSEFLWSQAHQLKTTVDELVTIIASRQNPSPPPSA